MTNYTNHELYNTTKGKKIVNDPTKHYPNKNESRLLRKIMADTGLNGEEVRQHKKYRKMLSEAQKMSTEPKSNKSLKWYRNRIKEACIATGLAPQHPDTIEKLEEILAPYWNHMRYLPWHITKLNAKTIVDRYAK